MINQAISIDKLPDGEDIKFTVDAALFSELGERLVGKPYVALGELIKNSYDADATKVTIRFGDDLIEIIDNGHGMDFKEFESFWMRVGTQHKQRQRYSKKFQRPMTGSKGVGRLAVQLMAKEIGMRTVSEDDQNLEIQVYVNWSEAQQAGELTEAIAKYRITETSLKYPGNSKHGTAIILSGLNQTWDTDAITELAQEIWPLQPPFRTARGGILQEEAFDVELEAPDPEAVTHFENQMEAVLDIWDAKLNGRLIPASHGKNCKVELTLEFKGAEKILHEYEAIDYTLNSVEFEIRIFTLKGKQPSGIIVDDAREYFRSFGGIHVYDSGFRMPFYGTVEGDWLRIQYDQASRRHKSILLPEELQVFRGLQFLPTLSRSFGVVHVDTAKEREIAEERNVADKGEYLQLQVTRDRLVDNSAHESLRDIVRYAVDYYAMREAARQYSEKETQRPTEPVQKKIERVEDVIARYREDIPRPAYRTLSREVKSAVTASKAEQERITRQAGLLGALATTGMSALAYEHEIKKHHFKLLELARELGEIKVDDPTIQEQLDSIVRRLNAIIDQSRSLRAVFSAMLEEENRTTIGRFKARSLIRDVSDQLGILLRGVRPTTHRVDDDLLLPQAGFAEWSAIFQNILLNAVNAMLDNPDAKTKRINVSSRIDGDRRTILIQDTGVGANLTTAEELFKPFVRKLKISPERKALGVGGTGLGLTIVRMITDNIGCNVSFTNPEDGFTTAFQIQWREKT
ncbi:MAG: sensor histidine kinase [Chloroflexi bacterium]|nr:sensor histidine kinase [Chloroflexota bacterium]